MSLGGVLTSRLSPTAKISPLDVDSQYLDLKQYTTSALLSSIVKPNPLSAPSPAVASLSGVANAPRNAAAFAKTPASDSFKALDPSKSVQHVANVTDVAALSPVTNSPIRAAVPHEPHKTNQPPKPVVRFIDTNIKHIVCTLTDKICYTCAVKVGCLTMFDINIFYVMTV